MRSRNESIRLIAFLLFSVSYSSPFPPQLLFLVFFFHFLVAFASHLFSLLVLIVSFVDCSALMLALLSGSCFSRFLCSTFRRCRRMCHSPQHPSSPSWSPSDPSSSQKQSQSLSVEGDDHEKEEDETWGPGRTDRGRNEGFGHHHHHHHYHLHHHHHHRGFLSLLLLSIHSFFGFVFDCLFVCLFVCFVFSFAEWSYCFGFGARVGPWRCCKSAHWSRPWRFRPRPRIICILLLICSQSTQQQSTATNESPRAATATAWSDADSYCARCPVEWFFGGQCEHQSEWLCTGWPRSWCCYGQCATKTRRVTSSECVWKQQSTTGDLSVIECNGGDWTWCCCSCWEFRFRIFFLCFFLFIAILLFFFSILCFFCFFCAGRRRRRRAIQSCSPEVISSHRCDVFCCPRAWSSHRSYYSSRLFFLSFLLSSRPCCSSQLPLLWTCKLPRLPLFPVLVRLLIRPPPLLRLPLPLPLLLLHRLPALLRSFATTSVSWCFRSSSTGFLFLWSPRWFSFCCCLVRLSPSPSPLLDPEPPRLHQLHRLQVNQPQISQLQSMRNHNNLIAVAQWVPLLLHRWPHHPLHFLPPPLLLHSFNRLVLLSFVNLRFRLLSLVLLLLLPHHQLLLFPNGPFAPAASSRFPLIAFDFFFFLLSPLCLRFPLPHALASPLTPALAPSSSLGPSQLPSFSYFLVRSLPCLPLLPLPRHPLLPLQCYLPQSLHRHLFRPILLPIPLHLLLPPLHRLLLLHLRLALRSLQERVCHHGPSFKWRNGWKTTG